jgi:hypothetical protein
MVAGAETLEPYLGRNPNPLTSLPGQPATPRPRYQPRCEVSDLA